MSLAALVVSLATSDLHTGYGYTGYRAMRVPVRPPLLVHGGGGGGGGAAMYTRDGNCWRRNDPGATLQQLTADQAPQAAPAPG